MAMTSEQFKAARERLELSQRELGNIMGMRQPAIARIESGVHGVTKIHEAFLKVLEEMKGPLNWGDLINIRIALLQLKENTENPQDLESINKTLDKIEDMFHTCGYLIM